MEEIANQGRHESHHQESAGRCFSRCQFCNLESVQDRFCGFCQDFVDVVTNDQEEPNFQNHTQPPVHTHTSTTESPHHFRSNQQPCDSSRYHLQDSCDIHRCDHASTSDSCRLGPEAQCRGDQCSIIVDHPADQGTLGRGEGSAITSGIRRVGNEDQGSQEGISQEGRSLRISSERKHSNQSECHNCTDVQCGREDHHRGVRTPGLRTPRIREVWEQDHAGGVGGPSLLHPVGSSDCRGVGHEPLASSSSGQVELSEETSQGRDSNTQEEGLCEGSRIRSEGIRFQFCHGEPHGLGGHRSELHGGHQAVQHGQGNDIHGRSTHGQGQGDRSIEAAVGSSTGRASYLRADEDSQQGPSRDVEFHELSANVADMITQRWDAQRNPYSQNWQSLVHHNRPILMELACFPNSLLSTEVERVFGKGSAIRVSNWNGGDLETPEGVKHTKKMLRRFRPVHLWISCECSPYCPLQRLNRKTPEQRQRLEEKQEHARKQYQGAMEVAETAFQLGTQVHWELAERCEAWQLPMIQDFLQRYGMQKATCHGCTVGLKTVDQQKILCKGWTIATKNAKILQHMNLRCQKNHAKGKCEAGQTAHTARYTTAFVRRLTDCFKDLETWPRISQELQQEVLAAEDEEEELIPDDPEGQLEIAEDERKEIEKKIQHIHRNTGHSSMKNLIRALKLRGVDDKVLQVAKSWKCPVCTERKHHDPRKYATLRVAANKWECMEADMATWVHPVSNEKIHFVIMVDQGCRFKVGKIVQRHSANSAKWEDLRQAYEEIWQPVFGKPQTVRVDPAGPWLNKAADDYFADRGVFFDTIAAEAHWQLSTVEQTIKSVKGVMEQLATEFPDMLMEELLGRSIWVCNDREIYKGYSPFQHAMGRSPDQHGRFFTTDDNIPLTPEMLVDAGFRSDHQIRCVAEKAFAEEEAKRRLERATHMGHRRSQVYIPGDLVFYWRRQLPHKDKQVFRSGKFLGPARVVATETRQEEGELRPANIVWLHRAGRLIKAAPEQLRKASEFEQQVEELKGAIDLPWTITQLASDPKRRTYVDIAQDLPNEAEWEESLDIPTDNPGAELGIPTHRLTRKATVLPDGQVRNAKQSRLEETRGTKRTNNTGGESSGSGVRRRVEEEDILMDENSLDAFFAIEEHQRGLEIQIELPESNRKWKQFLKAPEVFMAQQVKRRQVEVKEKTLTPAELKQFHEAKATEVRNFLASECFQLAGERTFKDHEVLGMRWLLTWKYDEKYVDQGGRKAKARAIVLGYQDPLYEHRQTSAPTPSKAGRQLFFQMCAWKRFLLAKGDVSGAFLQGMNLEEELWCKPVPEICAELGVAEDTPMLLTKAAYGLVQAPLHWYRSVCIFLEQLGYRKLVTEPCCWIFQDETGAVKSIIHGHVDDFMFGGGEHCPIHQGLMTRIQQQYKWGQFEYKEFIQCGVCVKQDEHFNIWLSQEKFIDELEEIHLNRDRQRQSELPTTDREKSQLRGVLGSLSWLCGQTCFLYSVDVNFLISTIPVSTVGDINKANQLVRNIRKWKQQSYIIHAFPPDSELIMACWTDAAWANRPNNKDSTEGIFVGIAEPRLEFGFETNITPVYWRSGKIERTCRSPACAETMASLNGEDDLLYLRVLWNEMQGHSLNPRFPNKTACITKGLLITDARNLYDKLHRATVCVKGAEKRSDIEAISLREHAEDSNVHIAWVHGGAMLANGLTKTTEKHQMFLFLQLNCRWRITYDEERRSEKVRKKLGVEPLAGDAVDAVGAHKHTLTKVP